MVISTMTRLESKAVKGVRERPLAWHLAALCFALALPILILIGMLTWSYAETEHARIEQDAVRSAHDVIAATDRELAGLIATTEVLALSRSLQSDDLDAFDAQARRVNREIGINVVLRNRESQQLVNTRLPRGAPLPTNVDRDSDLTVLATKKPFVSNLFIGGVTRKPLFMVNVPVLRNGEVAYFLSLSLAPEQMRDLILETRLPAGWTAGIVDRRGFVVAHSSRHEAMLNQQLSNSIWRQFTGRDGILSGQNAAGDHQPVLIAYSRSQLSGLTAVVTIPAEQAKAPLRRTILTLAGIGGGISALSVGLALAFSRRIAGPVDALSAQAAQLGAGEAVHPLATAIREVNVVSNVLSVANRERHAADVARISSEQRLRELQFELLHASRLSTMGQMTATLAHELNQPLGAAANFLSAAQLALKASPSDSSARALTRIEKAIEQTVHAGAILGRLRNFIARGETEKEFVAPSQLIEDAVSLAVVGVRDPNFRIGFDFMRDERPIVLDRVQIQQVVFNLVRNALEATEGTTPREIVIATRLASESELEVSVSDNGCGLPEDAEAVFRPFTTTKAKGMGVGLSICRTIVEAHGGRLWAERRAAGGAVFRFTLPIAQEAINV
jgi:signal transduction histidine kinase